MNNNKSSNKSISNSNGNDSLDMISLLPQQLPPHTDLAEVRRLLEKYPLPASHNHSHYVYGTAGFRLDAHVLPPIMVRIGVAAALSSVLLSSNGNTGTNPSTSTGTGTHPNPSSTTQTMMPMMPMTPMAVGVMITASHNDESYNGVKLCDVTGGMMRQQGEDLAVELVNMTTTTTTTNDDSDALVQRIRELQSQCQYHNHHTSSMSMTQMTPQMPTPMTPVVHIGRDTRSHSAALACLVVRTARAMGAVVIDHGVVTTPQLHWCVQHANPTCLPLSIPIMTPTVTGYQDLMAQSYLALLQTATATATAAPAADADAADTTTTPQHQQQGQHQQQKLLLVDCACGVGYPHLQSLLRKIESLSNTSVNASGNGNTTTTTATTTPTKIVATNAPGTGPLNEQCGSEHVQKSLEPPVWYQEEQEEALEEQEALELVPKTYCASLDGDADRIVFFSVVEVPSSSSSSEEEEEKGNNDSNNSNTNHTTTVLLDGDKIACLICHFLQKQFAALGTADAETAADVANLKLGVVQTAYANGASTAYLESILNTNANVDANASDNKSSNVFITKTGVKYVHAAAHREFDVGVYFEANGHGTVLFNDAFYQVLAAADIRLRAAGSAVVPSAAAAAAAAAATALQRLKVLPSLINQAVGDALSDLLLVDAILRIEHMTILDWNAMYTDLPSRQLKVQVRDRSLIVVNDNETVCCQPAAVQTALDAAMAEFNGRAFVRPSGTEDVVRIYAEAADRAAADGLAAAAAAIVYRLCDGVGEAPPVFPVSRM